MAASASFSATPKTWAKAISATADGTPTSHTPTGGTVTVVTGASTGTKVEEIAVQGIDSAADAAVVTLWLHDGTTYFGFDQFKRLGTSATTTAPGERNVRSYGCLIVANGWTLQASCSVASQLIDVVAFGGDF